MATRHKRITARGATLLLLAFAACGTGMPEGRSDIAAEAGTITLTPDRLAAWISLNPSGQATIRAAEFAALVWVDYALLAQAIEQGLPLSDSATATIALEPDIILQQLRDWHDTLVSRRPRIAADRADSLYASDRRVLQHILLRVDDPNDAGRIGETRAKAESLVAVARSGADFSELAREHSQDASTAENGYLPIVGRGVLAPEFERTAWRIGPGEVGGAGSRLGFHVVRRPPLEEVRDRLTAYAESLATQRADSVYTTGLRIRKALTVTPEAVSALRRFFAAHEGRTDGDLLATWDGGALSLDQAASWIDALPPRAYLDLRGASDVALEAFVRDIATQYLILGEANEGGVRLLGGQQAGLFDGYRRGLRESLALLGLTDSTTSLPAGEGAGRVNALMEAFARDQTRWSPLPSALAAYLRATLGFQLHRAGLERSVSLATDLITAQVTPLTAPEDAPGARDTTPPLP